MDFSLLSRETMEWYKWIEWEHLYDCTDYDTLRFWLNQLI